MLEILEVKLRLRSQLQTQTSDSDYKLGLFLCRISNFFLPDGFKMAAFSLVGLKLSYNPQILQILVKKTPSSLN